MLDRFVQILLNFLRRFFFPIYVTIVFMIGWFCLTFLTTVFVLWVSPKAFRPNPLLMLIFSTVVNAALLFIGWFVYRQEQVLLLEQAAKNRRELSISFLISATLEFVKRIISLISDWIKTVPEVSQSNAIKPSRTASSSNLNSLVPKLIEPKDFNLFLGVSIFVSATLSLLLFVIINLTVDQTANRGLWALPHLSFFALTAILFHLGILLSENKESFEFSFQYISAHFGILVGASLAFMLNLYFFSRDYWSFRIFLISRLIDSGCILITAIVKIRIGYTVENLRRKRAYN